MASAEGTRDIEAHAWPSEHIGHLSESQESSLAEFRQYCQSQSYYRPEQGTSPASHDDETLLRFLRARKWNVKDAFKQFKDTEDWRKDNQIDKLYDTIDVEAYDIARRLYPQWIGRRDKRGIPIYIFELANLTSKALSEYENKTSTPVPIKTKLAPKMLQLFALYENLCKFVLPLCSMMPDRPYPETPVSQSSNIVDLTGVSMMQMWNLKAHMADASELATAHYPETLDRIFVIGAPSFFPTVWGWVKKWFDPITVSKVFVLSKADTLPTLEKFMDRSSIPKKYGGDLDYNWGDLPHVQSDVGKNFEWLHPNNQSYGKTIPTGPIRWRRSQDGKLVAVAVGIENGKQRETEIASMNEVLPEAANLVVGEKKRPTPLTRLPTGVSTHPRVPSPSEQDHSGPPSGVSTPVNNNIPGAGHDTASSLPDRSASSVVNTENNPTTTSSVRQGTTVTRQQAEGVAQPQYPTPITTHHEIRRDEFGDSHGVVETKTVGQAPKSHPIGNPQDTTSPGVIEKVKDVAAGVVESVSSATSGVANLVGLGGQTQHNKDEPAEVAEKQSTVGDDLVDKLTPAQIEEFLRARTSSTK